MSKNLNSRVQAAVDTWVHKQHVKLEIFARNNGTWNSGGGRATTLAGGTKIIQLPGVSDTSYPPQKKSFSMLKYIHDNHLKK